MSYYSSMLPGSVADLYEEDELKINLEALAKWSGAEFILGKVSRISGDDQRVYLEGGQVIEYDLLSINIGSKTKAVDHIPGVWEHSLTTRSLNELIPKIKRREVDLKVQGIVPEVVVCGAGAAGTELSFAFKARWTKQFGQDVKVKLLCY